MGNKGSKGQGDEGGGGSAPASQEPQQQSQPSRTGGGGPLKSMDDAAKAAFQQSQNTGVLNLRSVGG